MDVVRRYLRLGLQFDKLEEGFVDAYTGDPALRREVANEPAPDPREMKLRAGALLGELPSSGLPAERMDFLRGQLRGLEVSAAKFAGEQVGFVDEVEAYFQVRPELGDTGAYEAAHRELDAVLPGDGPLTERYDDHRRRDQCPAEKLEAVVAALNSALRDLTRGKYGLPEQETVEYQIVTDKPWSGFNYYLGDYVSRVAINADLPARLAHLPHLVAHESYPGHHTEHCRKEAGLVAKGGQDEQRIFLVNTPQCLLAEGLADLGVRAAIGPGWGRWAQEVYADFGFAFDGEQVERVAAALGALDRVRQDAAILLHDRGASEEEVVGYLTRWLLVGEDRAKQSLRFLTDPLWRAYTSTYVEGYALLSSWLDARPADVPVEDRFLRLLDEPLTPAGIRAELGDSQ